MLVPGNMYRVMPIAALLGTIYTLAQFAQTSEFTIMRASSMSTRMAAWILFKIGIVFVVVTFIFGELITPRTAPLAERLRLSAKGGDVENAYYADQPYRFTDGKPRGIPSLDTQFGNVGGDAFANIAVPVSTFAHESGFRAFKYRDGVKAKTAQIRLDIEKPVTDSIDLFAHTRYLKYSYDFNGLFPGSGTGNAGLTSAVNYLTLGGGSPINDLLQKGLVAFPTTTRFGIKNLRTGVVLGSNQTAELNALNGNGFLQRTTLNHDYIDGKDFGLNAGGRWEYQGESFTNSLTAGVMYYNVKRSQDQSATASVVNDTSGARLVLTSANSGAADSLRVTVSDDDGISTDASGLSQLAYDPAAAVGAGRNLTQSAAAQDASFKLNGLTLASASNTVSGAAPREAG